MKNFFMIEESKIKIHEGKRRTGKDEMNLIELPFTLLTKRNPKGLKTIERTWTGKGVDGKTRKFYKIITGSDKWGLPTFIGEEVYLACMELSYKQGFKDRKVYTTQYDFLKLMDWPIGGSGYRRLIKAFNQLIGISISTNAFWNNEKKKYQKLGFGLIDDYCFFEDEKKGRKNNYKQLSMPLGFFHWNQIFFEQSLQKNNIKTINTGLYFSLKSYTAKRLYRFVDKKLYHQESFEIDLFKLAFEKMEMTGNYLYPSKVMEKLKPAMKELRERGIAESYIKKSKTESGYKVCFTPPTKPQVFAGGKEETSLSDTPEGKEKGISDTQRLVEYFHNKLNPEENNHQATQKEIQQARDLLGQYGKEEVKYIIDFALGQAEKTKFKMCYFGAILNYVNDAVNSLKKEKEQKEKEQALLKEQKEQAKLREQFEEYKNGKIDAYLKKLSPEEKQEELKKVKAELYERYPISRTWGNNSQVLKSTVESIFIENLKNDLDILTFPEWLKIKKIVC